MINRSTETGITIGPKSLAVSRDFTEKLVSFASYSPCAQNADNSIYGKIEFIMFHRFAVLMGFAVSACLPTFEAEHPAPTPVDVVPFSEIPTPFTHVWAEPAHPFTGAAVIDVDGDGRLEIFVGGGRGQADMLLGFRDGALVDVMSGLGLSDNAATHGMASSDIDSDGDVDLVVARENALTVYENTGNGFTSKIIPIDIPMDAVPMSVSVSDINGDGLGDLYVSMFVSFEAFKSATFNDPTHAKLNVMLVNEGGMSFRDVTAETGTAGTQNSFHTTFVDLDNDGDQDMVIAQNTAEVEFFERTGPMKFHARLSNTGYGFWMGLGVGDPDQDGDQDIFVSNIGSSIPNFLTKGDLKDDQRHNTEWAYLRNDGAFTFTDISEAMNLRGYGFAWGAQFEDLNLDGLSDILVAQNYIKWPLHKWAPLPGKVLLQLDTSDGGGFYQVDGLGLDNAHYAQSPLIVDLDADGRADVLWLNMNGPLRAFINNAKGNFIAVRVPDDVRTLGAHVTVRLADGKEMTRQVIASTGLLTDPTPNVHFGLGRASDIESITLYMPSGASTTINTPDVNSTVSFVLH